MSQPPKAAGRVRRDIAYPVLTSCGAVPAQRSTGSVSTRVGFERVDFDLPGTLQVSAIELTRAMCDTAVQKCHRGHVRATVVAIRQILMRAIDLVDGVVEARVHASTVASVRRLSRIAAANPDPNLDNPLVIAIMKSMNKLPYLTVEVVVAATDGTTVTLMVPASLPSDDRANYLRALYTEYVRPDGGDSWKGPCHAHVPSALADNVAEAMDFMGSIVDTRSLAKNLDIVVLRSKGYHAHGF